MASQFYLFQQKKFRSMFFTQFLGAFNDNVFKQALILVLTYTAASKLGQPISLLTNLAALLFILPFFLFSALAGQIADKYEKAFLTRQIKLLEILIMGFATIGFLFEIYSLLFVALFLMGTHSAFFGPIKYAYLPEVMHKDDLVGANGLFQMGTSLAILTGMMMAGFLTQLNNALLWTSITVVVIALLGYLTARGIPKTTHYDTKILVNYNIFKVSFDIIKFLIEHKLLFFIVLGNSWFWFYGATFLTQAPEFGKVILYGNESVVILLLTLFSVGTALGSVLCKTLSKNEVNLKLLPIGIIGLSAFAIDLYFSLTAYAHHFNTHQLNTNTYYSIGQIISITPSLRVFFDLFALGFAGGIYIVPLYALMQACSPISHRARVVGANNIFNAIFMVGSALFSIIILTMVKLSIGHLFVLTGILNALFGIWLYRQLKKYFNANALVTE